MNGLRIKVKWTKVGLKKSGRHFEKVANFQKSNNFRDVKKILKLVTMEGMGMGTFSAPLDYHKLSL